MKTESELQGGVYAVTEVKKAYLCFCSSIFSRALTSTSSNPEKISTQRLAISLIENSDGNRDPHRIDSIISDLHNEVNKTNINN